jgi:hypothetical protein
MANGLFARLRTNAPWRHHDGHDLSLGHHVNDAALVQTFNPVETCETV